MDKVARLIERELAAMPELLEEYGLTPDEYQRAYLPAIQQLRGRISATDKAKRTFVETVLHAGEERGVFASVAAEVVGRTRLHRVELPDQTTIALARKGCPDGNHTALWERPAWADELFLWWLCPDSQAHQPGTSIWKGVGRVRRKTLSRPESQLDGLIFFDPTCGTARRPCPKTAYGLEIEGVRHPPPCVFTYPRVVPGQTGRLNWAGSSPTRFGRALLCLFGVPEHEVARWTGWVGLELATNGGAATTRVTNQYGDGRICRHTG